MSFIHNIPNDPLKHSQRQKHIIRAEWSHDCRTKMDRRSLPQISRTHWQSSRLSCTHNKHHSDHSWSQTIEHWVSSLQKNEKGKNKQRYKKTCRMRLQFLHSRLFHKPPFSTLLEEPIPEALCSNYSPIPIGSNHLPLTFFHSWTSWWRFSLSWRPSCATAPWWPCRPAWRPAPTSCACVSLAALRLSLPSAHLDLLLLLSWLQPRRVCWKKQKC